MLGESKEARRLYCLRHGINANFIIGCQGREWHVDRGFLIAESPYFKALFTGHFREASLGKLTLDEEEPEVIDQVLVYIYTWTYDDLAVVAEPDVDPSNSTAASVPHDVPQKQFPHGGNAGSESQDDDGQDNQEEPDAAPDSLMLWQTGPFPGKVDEPRLEHVNVSDMTRILTTGVRLYQCAKWMGIEELATKAATLVKKRELYWPLADLLDFFETVFEITESDDDQIRALVLQRCAANRVILADQPDLLELIRKWEPLAWQFAIKAQVELETRIKTNIALEKQYDIAIDALLIEYRKVSKKKARIRRRNQTIRTLEGNVNDLVHQVSQSIRDKEHEAQRYSKLEFRKQKARADFLDLLQMKGRVMCPTCKKHRKITDAGKRDEHGKRQLKCRKGHLMVSVREED